MARLTPAQQAKVHTVLQEFKRHKLRSGAGPKAPKVVDRKQAIAIAMRQAGAPRRRR